MNVMLSILGIVWFVSLLNIILEYLQMKRFDSTLPDVVKDLYPKVLYKRYIKKEKRNVFFDSIKRVLLVLLFTIGLTYGYLRNWYDLVAREYGQGVFVDFFFLFGVFLVIALLELILEVAKRFLRTKKVQTKPAVKRFFQKTFKKAGLRWLLVIVGTFLILLSYKWLGSLFFFILYGLLVGLLILLSLYFTKWIVPLFHSIEALENGELKEKIGVFLRQEGYQIQDVYVLKNGLGNQLNAFISGFSNRKRIVLFEGLIRKLRDDEIIAVLAHELGHEKSKHILFNLGFSFVIVAGFVFGFALVMTGDSWIGQLGIASHMYGMKFLLYIVLVEGYLLLVRFLLARNAKRFEYQADQYAKKVWYASSLRSALCKIAKRNMEHLTPHPIYEMVYFTHPSLVNRLKKLNQEDD